MSQTIQANYYEPCKKLDIDRRRLVTVLQETYPHTLPVKSTGETISVDDVEEYKTEILKIATVNSPEEMAKVIIDYNLLPLLLPDLLSTTLPIYSMSGELATQTPCGKYHSRMTTTSTTVLSVGTDRWD